MRRLSKSAKKRLVNIFAGVTAVCISPPIATMIGNNADNISASLLVFAGNVGEYMEESITVHKPPVLVMNNSARETYKPSEIPTTLPPETTSPEPQIVVPIPDNEPIDNNLEYDIDQEHAAVMSFNISGFSEDLSIYSNIDGKVIESTFKPNGGENFINLTKAGQVRNTTDLANSRVNQEVKLPPSVQLEMNGEPEVLIMHTHTSESFQLSNQRVYDNEYPSRSTDPTQNIVAVGARIAEGIAAHGIGVIHDGTIHDNPEYKGAYDRSAAAVKELLSMYPSIKIVLDIHRDAIVDDGSPVAAVTEINGKNAAQIMIIAAADDGTYNLPNYMNNLRLASHLQQQMETDNPTITRPVLFQYCHYNQDLADGSLLIEVGSHGNTIDEALYTGELIGDSIGKALAELR